MSFELILGEIKNTFMEHIMKNYSTTALGQRTHNKISKLTEAAIHGCS